MKLRVHVTEPWDFERIAGTADLTGWTTDHADPDNREWEVHLDRGFDFNDHHIGSVLAGPRYVGERLSRVFDTVTGFSVRLAHHIDGAWHFAFTATISQRHDQPDTDRDRRKDQDNGAI
nr:hypothetical protein [Sphingobium sp. BYY-5]